MQGRDEGPMNRPSEPRLPSMNGTSKYRAIPQRPPGMTRLETPPEMPRVPRPQRSQEQPGKLRRRLLIFCAVLAVAAVIVGVAVSQFVNLGLTNSSGPAIVANDFLTAIAKTDYQQAYTDLGPAITISSLTPENFAAQAKALDRCYGTVKSYAEVMDSATVENNVQSYTYTITRSRLAQPYQLRIRLQQSSQPDDAKWKIIDYSGSLGPGHNAPACSKP